MGEPTVTGLHASGCELHRAQLRRATDSATGHVEVVELGLETLCTSESSSGADSAVAASSTRSTIHIASMPSQDVMSRCWPFPRTDDVRLRQMVAHRLEADLPVPIETLTWDCRRGGVASSNDATTHVLAQAASTERIDRYLTSLAACGIRVNTLTTDAEALEALCRYGFALPETDDVVPVILATEERWLVFVMVGGVVRSVRRIDAVAHSLERVYQMCQQCLDAERSTHEFNQVWWCSSPELTALRDTFAEKISLPIKTLSPAETLVTADGEPVRDEDLARFGPAIGLALAGLFKLDQMIRLAVDHGTEAEPAHERLAWIVNQPKRWLTAAAALVFLVIVIHMATLASETSQMKAYLDDDSHSASAMDALEPKIRAKQRIDQNRLDVEAIMAVLCEKLSDETIISTLELSRGRGLVIAGKAKDKKSITKLANDLDEDERFDRVYPQRIQKDGEFTMTAELVGVTKLSSAKRGGRW